MRTPSFSLILAAAVAAGTAALGTQALAQQSQPAAPIATAQSNGSGGAPAGDDVDKQIAAFVNAPLHAAPADDGVAPERTIHGEVSAAVGNHGYYGFYGRVDIPVGQTSTVSVAAAQDSIKFGDTRFTRKSLAIGAQLGNLGSARSPACGWSGMMLPGDKPCARWTGLTPQPMDLDDPRPMPAR